MISGQDMVTASTTPEVNYKTYCSGCHGNEMEAFVDRKWRHGNSKESLIKSIKVGIKDAGMPAYDTTFTSQQLEELADYILTGIEKRKTYDIQEKKTPKYYDTQYMNLQVDTVVNGIEIPWGIKVTEDGTIFFTERKGTLKVRKTDGAIVKIKNTPPVRNENQGGMLDVALHPDYQENSMIYLSYSKYKKEGGKTLSTTAVIRGKLEEDELKNIEEIFVAQPFLDSKYHYGSRLVFDKEGYLFVTVGDRGRRNEHPQFLTNSCGKVHRIYDDGRIPEDNPFTKKDGAIASIWSYGHRNPQGLVLDTKTGTLWEHEHGPRGGDELNKIEPGLNYGWPTVSYGINYNGTTFTEITKKDGMIHPENVWIPSIAPSGMAIVNSDKYPKWNGDILTGSLRFNYVSRVKHDGEKLIEEEMILKGIGRVRSIEMGADGYIYVGVEETGRILRVLPRM